MRQTWKLIYKGLILESSCKYFYIHQGDIQRASVRNDVYELVYKPQDTSESLGRLLGIPYTINMELGRGMMHPEKVKEVFFTINGLKFRKLTYDPHALKIVIVGDNETRVIQDYNYTTIVVNKDHYRDSEFLEYLLYSGNLQYIIPEKNIRKKSWNLRNIPGITIKDKDINFNSESETVYYLTKKYDNYIIRAIDYQEQFIKEFSRILEEYGIELTRINREETLTRSSYVSYNFSSTPIRYNHPRWLDDGDSIMCHKLPVDFTFRCSNTKMYYDFKNKYNNVDFITNFCEFKTTDKYGKRWSAAIKWGQITEDFNHMYQGDDNSNYSLQCSFRCELYFYEVYDTTIGFLNDIRIQLEGQDLKDQVITSDYLEQDSTDKDYEELNGEDKISNDSSSSNSSSNGEKIIKEEDITVDGL